VELALDNQEDFVAVGVQMPTILPVKNRHPNAAVVELQQDLVAVCASDLMLQGLHIQDLQRTMTWPFGGILFR